MVLRADGKRSVVTRVSRENSRTALAYNLSVEDFHTFHVGQSSVLVHNTCGPNRSDREGRIAQVMGKSQREIKDAIHRLKRRMPRDGERRNPNVVVDLTSGEVYIRQADGTPGEESIGNIYDELRD